MRAWFTQVFGMFRVQGFDLAGRWRRGVRHHRDRAWQLERDVPAQERITRASRRAAPISRSTRSRPDGSALILRDAFNGLPG